MFSSILMEKLSILDEAEINYCKNKAGRDEVSGRKNWQDPNICFWTSIRNSNKPQHPQTASMEKDTCFWFRTDVGKDHCVRSQDMMCDRAHSEQEPLSLGQVAMPRCWTGEWGVALVSRPAVGESLLSRVVGWQKSHRHPRGPYGNSLSH